MTIIYGLVGADTLELRYVGQTCNLDRRRAAHLRRYPNLRMLVLERNPPEGLAAAERRWITEMRAQGAQLLNIANGGCGPSEETRAKISTTNMGKMPSAETRVKQRAAHLGRTFSAETRAKMRAAALGNQRATGHVGRNQRSRQCH